MTATVERSDPPRAVRSVRAGGSRRSIVVVALLAVVAFGLVVLTLMVGSAGLTSVDVVGSLLGLADDRAVDFIVRELRLPTATTGLGVGVALGVAGTLFQRVLVNPLASPDFVGVSAGAGLFAVSAIVVFPGSALGTSVAALTGALTAAGLIYLLAWRGGISGYRFILVGIGISQLMVSLTAYVLARAELFDAREAMSWLVGSLGRAQAGELRLLLVTVVVMIPLVVVLGRPLAILELGDDAARALGVRVEATRLGLLAVAVVLVAAATAVAGPLAFVALLAGPIASRLLGGRGAVLPAAALVGVIIVLAADLVARHLLPSPLPTGVVTGAIGAPYLVWLLARVNAGGRGG